MPLTGNAKIRSLGVIDEIATELGCEAAVIDAIVTVEAVGKAYDPASRLIIRPEVHKIASCPYLTPEERTKAAKLGFTKKVKWIDYGRDGLIAGDQRWKWVDDFRMAFGDEAAYWVCSFGSPQIMGFNCRLCGYDLPSQMVIDFADSEDAQIRGMCRFLKSAGLVPALRQRQWKQIARLYNGKDYAKNSYDVKMAKAYEQSNARKGAVIYDPHDADMIQYGDHGAAVTLLQEKLRSLGFYVDADGDFGIETKDAVMAFQRRSAIAADGKVGPKTQKALELSAPKEPNTKPAMKVIAESQTAQAGLGTLTLGSVATAISAAGMVATPSAPVPPPSLDSVNDILVYAERGIGMSQKVLALGADKILIAIGIAGIIFGGLTLYRRLLAQRLRKVG